MSRADELRAQLQAVEAEDSALAVLDKARAAFRARPDDPAAKDAAQAAAVAVRRVRGEQRADRVVTGGPGDAVISPRPVAASATVKGV